MNKLDLQTIENELRTIRILLKDFVTAQKPKNIRPYMQNGYYCRCPNKYTGDDNFCGICGGLSFGNKEG